MDLYGHAARAYEGAASQRNAREQEADVFRRANGALRAAQANGPVATVRALVDNRRLWSTVLDLVRDPENKLPAPLRAGIVSVGISVQREMDAEKPDLKFLIDINDMIASGLSAMPSLDAAPDTRPVVNAA
jgi:flagellar biosynthesis regulator FlaF